MAWWQAVLSTAVGPPVCHVTVIYSKFESRTISHFGVDTTMDMDNWDSTFCCQWIKVKVIENEHVKCFRAHQTDQLRQTKTSAHSKHIVEYIVVVCATFFCILCHIPLVHSEMERRRKYILYGEVAPYTNKWWSNFWSKVKIAGKEKENNSFFSRTYSRKSGSISPCTQFVKVGQSLRQPLSTQATKLLSVID